MTDFVAAGFNPPSMASPCQWSAVGTTNQGQMSRTYGTPLYVNLDPFIGGLKPAATKWLVATRLVLWQMKACKMLLNMGFRRFLELIGLKEWGAKKLSPVVRVLYLQEISIKTGKLSRFPPLYFKVEFLH
ncbi:hypothetical protein [Haliscomenobacter hydrossis]|uniref:Uncharacterized protein n=1 Tax=Haliscomenobacter hydrossis (strain ATCC 27775 / DSM 1100 / LMG 10767 / O) TaxID=760192 RepID=F4L717_HALH1|nr:hypothetical protein [Haliscomenobacter hydrossis]AEE52093.1 hypothetical protein Halhy_4249 [Haliscomenobacter hydrossis DSM 1100]